MAVSLYRIVHAAITGFTVRFKPQARDPARSAPGEPGEPGPAKPAGPELGDCVYAQRCAFLDQMNERLVGMNQDVDRLLAELGRSAAPPDVAIGLQRLRDQIARLENRLERAVAASESAWPDARDGSSAAYAAVRRNVDQAGA